jgi:hypothetical protein
LANYKKILEWDAGRGSDESAVATVMLDHEKTNEEVGG